MKKNAIIYLYLKNCLDVYTTDKYIFKITRKNKFLTICIGEDDKRTFPSKLKGDSF